MKRFLVSMRHPVTLPSQRKLVLTETTISLSLPVALFSLILPVPLTIPFPPSPSLHQDTNEPLPPFPGQPIPLTPRSPPRLLLVVSSRRNILFHKHPLSWLYQPRSQKTELFALERPFSNHPRLQHFFRQKSKKSPFKMAKSKNHTAHNQTRKGQCLFHYYYFRFGFRLECGVGSYLIGKV